MPQMKGDDVHMEWKTGKLILRTILIMTTVDARHFQPKHLRITAEHRVIVPKS